MPDKFNFDDFEPVGEDGGEGFVRHTRDMGLWGAVLWPFWRRRAKSFFGTFRLLFLLF